MIRIWADGGVKGNGQVYSLGGYGAIVEYKGVRTEFSAAVPGATNNQMEMMGAIVALGFAKDNYMTAKKFIPITLTSDSQYLIKGITQWIHGWVKRNWQTKEDPPGPVKNQELWKQLYNFNRAYVIDWQWVKGHSTCAENNRCDELAGLAIKEYTAAHLVQGAPGFHPTRSMEPLRT